MTFKRCENGHFYDAERFDTCPFCQPEKQTADPLQGVPQRFRDMGSLREECSGSVGKVFQLTGQTHYALKQILCGSDSVKFQNALYELHIMERLSGCDRVVQLVDSEVVTAGAERGVYLLLEHCTPLNIWLQEEQPSLLRLIKLLRELCYALIQCRDRGVLHLDIQPGNLFLDKQGRLKLGDFSSSLLIEDLPRNRIPRGTPKYMAPEVAQDGLCSERSEIYSVGKLMEWLLRSYDLSFMPKDVQQLAEHIMHKAAAADLSQRTQTFGDLLNSIYCLFGRLMHQHYILSSNLPSDEAYYYIRKQDTHAKSFDADAFASTMALSVPVETSVALNQPYTYQTTTDVRDAILAAPSQATAPVTVPPPVAQNSVHCSACGSKISSLTWFCPCCGHYIGATDPGASVAPAAAPSFAPPPQPTMPTQPMPVPAAPAPAAQAPQVDIRKAQFSAVVPKTFLRGEYTMVEIVMYEEKFRHVVDQLIAQADGPVSETKSGIFKVAEDSRVRITLTSPDVEIEDNTDEQVWCGDHLNFTFAVELPEDYKKKQILFTAAVYINDFIATRLKFVAKVRSFLEQKVTLTREDVLSAFVSYASQDRNRVAAIIQGMRKARPDMDIFFDVDSLRSGEDWELALRREIERRDILYLCWSQHARMSKWVDTEWRLAMSQKGVECIEPIAIDPPDVCPPPAELMKKHFNDKLLYYINAPRPQPPEFP